MWSGAGGKLAKAQLLCRLYRRLWGGDVQGAIAVLEAERPEAKNVAKLDELIEYLRVGAPWSPNYRQRRIDRQYVGSAHAEKANELMLNGGWDQYWQQREVLPLLAS